MAIRIKNKLNTHPEDSEYPYGDIRDNDGSNNGTLVNRRNHADFHQFFARMMGEAIRNAKDGFDYNDVPDNAYDGFQFYEALLRTKPYKYYIATVAQIGTNDPTLTVFENNIGAIVASRAGVGTYQLTLAGAFTSGRVHLAIHNGLPQGSNGTTVSIARTNANIITIYSYDTSNTLDDGILTDVSFEIRIY